MRVLSVALQVFFLILTLASDILSHAQNVTIKTPYGPITGFKNEKGSYSFLGVPFAQAMNRSTMFLPPQALEPWTEPLLALAFKPGCMAQCRGQFSSLMCPATVSATDCLYTDWYVPAPAIEKILNGSGSLNLPVMGFWHGGMALWGSPSIPLYKGDVWVQKANMILVGAAYRLNVWGALTTSVIKGNNAIRDMRAALMFMNKVASSFGGDPSNIVVSGQSAGAQMTVAAFAAVPSMWPYFSAAIAISAPTGLTLPTSAMAQQLGSSIMSQLNCSTFLTTAAEQLACLASKSDEDILKAESNMILPLPGSILSAIMSYQPFIDNDVIVGQPVGRIAANQFAQKPIYLSDVSGEAIIFLDTAYFPLTTDIIKIALEYLFNYDGEGDAIAKLYGPVPDSYWKKDGLEGGDMWAARILSDYLFECPNQWIAAKVQAAGLSSYHSSFQHVGSWSSWYTGPPKPGWGCNAQPNGTEENCCAQNGTHQVCHAYDLVTIFDTTWALPPNMGFPSLTKDETSLATYVQEKIFGQFVHNHTLPWPVFDNTTRPTYNISLPVSGVVKGYRDQYCRTFDLWGYNIN